MDRRSLALVAGTRPDARPGVLGAPPGVRGGHPGGRHRDHWRRSSHSAGLPAKAPGNRFPSGAGRPQRRRRGQPALRHRRSAPNTTYSSSVSLAEVTGVAARRVGVVIGVVFVGLAFFPKVAALLIAIPGPVAAAYVTVLIALLFVQGMKIIVQDGVDHRKAAVVGLSFWIGVGFQNQWIFADLLGEGFLGVLLGNGMPSGALAAVVLMMFVELTGPRRRCLEVALDTEALPKVGEFLRGFASRAGWNTALTEGRLVLVGEETLASLLLEEGDEVERAMRTAAGRHGPRRRGRGGVGVRVGVGRGESGGPAGVPGRDAGPGGCPGDIVPSLAALRLVGSPPEVPRRGHRYGARRWSNGS